MIRSYARHLIFWMDEMRAGTRTQFKRRWTPRGHRPKCRMKIGYEFVYLYAAICPYNGDVFAMLLPNMKQECFSLFIQYFAEYLEQEAVVFLDQASSHHRSENPLIKLEHLPPKSPELNPVERFFKEMRKQLSNQVFDSIEQVEIKISQIVEKYIEQPQKVINLTQFPYISASF